MNPIIYTHQHYQAWEYFVRESNNGTVFHSQDFFKYHPPDRFKHNHLMFEYRGAIIGALTACLMEVDGKRWLFSHKGASYGGFVIPNRLGVKEATLMVDSLLSYARKNRINGIELTQTPQIYYKHPHNHIDFALTRAGFLLRKREMSSMLRLEPLLEYNFARFKPEARTATRKSIKQGIIIKPSNDYRAFYDILKHNLRMRHNVKPTHSLEELHTLTSILPDDILLFGAFKETKMIAGVVIFRCNPQVILAFYISHDDNFQAYRPVNLLFYEIIRWGIEHRYSYLDYGIYTVNMDPNFGLAKFKESFGAVGIFRDTYFIEI